MGGFGSGMWMRWNTHRKKAFVQEYRSISSRMFPFKTMQKVSIKGIPIVLHEVNVCVFPTHVDVVYKSEKSTRILTIHLDQSKVNYGHSRYWMRCPSQYCQRRCGKLYLCKAHDGMPIFICRKCLNLAYNSQNRTVIDRLIDKKWDIIRKKLKADSNFIDEKPKWMHWKTFNSLKDQVEDLNRIATIRTALKFGHIEGAEDYLNMNESL